MLWVLIRSTSYFSGEIDKIVQELSSNAPYSPETEPKMNQLQHAAHQVLLVYLSFQQLFFFFVLFFSDILR